MMGSIGTMDEENGLLYSFILKGNSTYSTPVGSRWVAPLTRRPTLPFYSHTVFEEDLFPA